MTQGPKGYSESQIDAARRDAARLGYGDPEPETTALAISPPNRGAVEAPELAEHADAIRMLGNRAISDVIEIGKRLCRCKELCGHGNWLPWLKREFEWHPSTAEKYMQLFRRMRDDPRLRKFSPGADYGDLVIDIKALMAFAEPKTPDKVIEAVEARAAAGEKLSIADVKEEVAKAKSAEVRDDITELAEKAGVTRTDILKVKEALEERRAKRARPVPVQTEEEAETPAHDTDELADLIRRYNEADDKIGDGQPYERIAPERMRAYALMSEVAVEAIRLVGLYLEKYNDLVAAYNELIDRHGEAVVFKRKIVIAQ